MVRKRHPPGRLPRARRGWLLLPALLLAAAAALTALPPPPPVRAAGDLKLTLTAEEEQAAGALLLGSMAAYFGVDTHVVLDLAKDEPQPVGLLTAVYLAGDEEASVRQVIRLKKERGWRGAHERFAGPGRRGRGPRSDLGYERQAFVRFVHEYYAIPRETVILWLDRGLLPTDIILAIHLAERAHLEVTHVVVLRLQGLSWRAIVARHRLPWEWPVPPPRKARFGRVIIMDD